MHSEPSSGTSVSAVHKTMDRTPKPPDVPKEWPVSWEANRDAQLTAALSATAVQRLRWLEDALRLALLTGSLPAATGRMDQGREDPPQ